MAGSKFSPPGQSDCPSGASLAFPGLRLEKRSRGRQPAELLRNADFTTMQIGFPMSASDAIIARE